MEKKINKLQKEIDYACIEIKMFEEEYTFLLSEMDRFRAMKLAASTKNIIKDPEVQKILGEKLIKEAADGANKTLGELAVDKKWWIGSFHKTSDKIVSLHQKQISRHKQIKRIIISIKDGEHGIHSSDKDSMIYALDSSIKTYETIITFYLKTKNSFDKSF